MNMLAARSAALLHRVANRIGRIGAPKAHDWSFLDVHQAELGGVEPFDLGTVLAAYRAGCDDFFFVQVGAHTGGSSDPLAQSIRHSGLRGILVEPQKLEFAALSANYADQPQLILERAAIAAEDGAATLYKVNRAFWLGQDFPAGAESEISSLKREQIRRHVEIFGDAALAARESEYLETEEVPALTLRSLLSRHGVTRLDLLQIDTEGFDYEVLKMVDFAAMPPALINFEVVHLSDSDKLAAWDMLRGHGYDLYASNSYNTLAIRRGPVRRERKAQ
jgi:FkbM family methyltransferase